MLDAVNAALATIGVSKADAEADLEAPHETAVAIVGRPNVGKSSLFNALIGSPRVIVSDVPGTTRDAIDTRLVRGDTAFRLVDTAGMRRKRAQRQEIEYWSEKRALAAADRADIALVLIDGAEGFVDHDLDVADAARKAGCATLIVVSKWDASEIDLDDLRGKPLTGDVLTEATARIMAAITAILADIRGEQPPGAPLDRTTVIKPGDPR